MRLNFLLTGLLLAACSPAHAEMAVYTTDGLARVRPSDPPLVASSMEIHAARNEYEPFQVIVYADDEPLVGVNATASDLRSNSGAVIDASHITFFREQYVHVANASPRSSEGEGWYPDALIPFANPVTRSSRWKARFVGAPFDVAENTNQPVWVDVFVPEDATPGDYSGTLTVSAVGEKPVQIAVALRVWNITLPDTPSMRSNFGKLGADIATAHDVEMNSAAFRPIEWDYAVALAAHRISPIIPNTLYPRVHPDGSIDTSRTHEGLVRWINTFHVTGFPLRLLGDDPAGRDRAQNVTHLRAMYAYLKANGWETMAYVNVFDEPNDAAAYDEVRRLSTMIHDAQPGLKVLCIEQPVPENEKWGTLVGSVDIWVPLWSLWDDAAVAQRLRAGDEVWSYTALSQGRKGHDTPYWEIDFPLLNFRIPAWINFRCGATGLLYWSPVNWGVTKDMWTDPGTYHVQHDTYNGEGALFYPGTAAGRDGPIVSMRLEQIREGFEDYEYLKLLAARDRAAADEIVGTIARSWTDWDTRPQALYDARDAIAQRLTSPK
jgi:hypothetical protein